jgi:hypothetical protein
MQSKLEAIEQKYEQSLKKSQNGLNNSDTGLDHVPKHILLAQVNKHSRKLNFIQNNLFLTFTSIRKRM